MSTSVAQRPADSYHVGHSQYAPIAKLLNAPVIESKGRQFPVTIVYADECDPYTIAELTTHTILKALREHDGDFAGLPARRSRNSQMRRDAESNSQRGHPHSSSLWHAASKEQTAAILPNKEGKRKIVLATSIAETSLTIEGIKIVVDCGFCRIQRFDPDTSLSRLETVRISHDMADQRAGRAGRLCEGLLLPYVEQSHSQQDGRQSATRN